MSSAAETLCGQQIEGYRITRSIGHGGMGMIYEAVHPGIGQRAAIKVLFPTYSRDEEAVSRFVAEARAASRVRHPGLVKIFNHGRLADGTAYIMMEYLDGESLQARLLRLQQTAERMPLPEVLRIASQVASALAAVHREGIVHRDLKPANLLSFTDPEASGGERIKVVDFGIAKFISGTPSEVGKTTVGRFLGTALYASPEQCQMAGQVGPMADVYALGVILYEMLIGRPPFWAEHPGAVLVMHLSGRPRPLWEVRRSLPTPLCQLVHEMLRKEPAQRPSMEQIGARLGAVRLDAAEWPFQLWRRKGSVAAAICGVVLAGGLVRSLTKVGASTHAPVPTALGPARLAAAPPAALVGLAPAAALPRAATPAALTRSVTAVAAPGAGMQGGGPGQWTAAGEAALSALDDARYASPLGTLSLSPRASGHSQSGREHAPGRSASPGRGKPSARYVRPAASLRAFSSAHLAPGETAPGRVAPEPTPESLSPAIPPAVSATPRPAAAPPDAPKPTDVRREDRDEDEAFH